MRKTFLSALILILGYGLVLAKVAKAEDYGPPANIPNFDMSQIPAGLNIPSGLPSGMPGGTPTNMGPSAEQLEKMNQGSEMEAKGAAMQAAGEAKQKEAEKKAFEKMSKNINQFEKGVNIIKTQVAKLNKKGVPTTPGMQTELDKLEAFLVSLKTATTIDELQPLFEDFGDLMDSAQEQLQIMSKAAKWPAVEKQATSLITKLEKESVKLKASAAKKGLVEDLATSFSALDTAISEQKATLATLKTQVKTDPDAVFDSIGDYFDKFRAIYEDNVREINSSLDLKKAVKTELPKFISGLEKQLATVKKNKKFAAKAPELQAIVTQAKNSLSELKTVTAGKIVDMDVVVEKLDALTDLGTQFNDKLEEIAGQDSNPYEPKNIAPDKKDYEVKLPAGLSSLMK